VNATDDGVDVRLDRSEVRCGLLRAFDAEGVADGGVVGEAVFDLFREGAKGELATSAVYLRMIGMSCKGPPPTPRG
jgi:hypothetical protein